MFTLKGTKDKTGFTLSEVFSIFPKDGRKHAFTLAEVFSIHPKDNRKHAFTLAEVLITLGIIGVVAAVTAPMLIAKYQKYVLANQFKNALSVLTQGFQKMMADEEVIDFNDTDWNKCTVNGYPCFYMMTFSESVLNKLSEKSCVKTCRRLRKNYFNTHVEIPAVKAGLCELSSETVNGVVGGAFMADNCKGSPSDLINKGHAVWWYDEHSYGGFIIPTNYTATLELLEITSASKFNGMGIDYVFPRGFTVFGSYMHKYSKYSSIFHGNDMTHTKFTIDVNGVKGPNTLGRDVFPVVVTRSGNVVPIMSLSIDHYASSFHSSAKSLKESAEKYIPILNEKIRKEYDADYMYYNIMGTSGYAPSSCPSTQAAAGNLRNNLGTPQARLICSGGNSSNASIRNGILDSLGMTYDQYKELSAEDKVKLLTDENNKKAYADSLDCDNATDQTTIGKCNNIKYGVSNAPDSFMKSIYGDDYRNNMSTEERKAKMYSSENIKAYIDSLNLDCKEMTEKAKKIAQDCNEESKQIANKNIQGWRDNLNNADKRWRWYRACKEHTNMFYCGAYLYDQSNFKMDY
jgi:prepilin-type N-terminal cleavage/methylation domain-containing protein